MIKFADKMAAIEPFKVMEVLARANELKSMGNHVVDMEVGEPDFPTPAPIVRAAKDALDQNLTRYTNASGLPALKDEISAFYARTYGLDIAPSRIVITAGGSAALMMTCCQWSTRFSMDPLWCWLYVHCNGVILVAPSSVA